MVHFVLDSSMDPHQRPPEFIRNIYKKYQKARLGEIDADLDILDLENGSPVEQFPKVGIVDQLQPGQLNEVFQSFAGDGIALEGLEESVPVYEHANMPGLQIIPSLLPPQIQTILLTRLLHRDLAHPSHLTNIHTHYDLSYPTPPSSFFSFPPSHPTPLATPLNSTIHRPLTISQLLNKKLRWMTLGGQYDWTQKKYPDTTPPPFPRDIGALLEGVWKDTKAEAAIVNLYSPGDTLSIHRDVSESSARGLISVSLGCDAIFIIGTSGSADGSGEEEEGKALTIRLRSGSAVYMSGDSRFAWHGVPQIVPDTCPEYLKDWPSGSGGEKYEEWKGWMSGKRVNLNVRQMWDF